MLIKKIGVCLGLIRRLVWELFGVSVVYIFFGFVIGGGVHLGDSICWGSFGGQVGVPWCIHYWVVCCLGVH